MYDTYFILINIQKNVRSSCDFISIRQYNNDASYKCIEDVYTIVLKQIKLCTCALYNTTHV